MHPPPFPLYAQYANATWLLSDYSEEGGSLCFVPGSHLLCRQPGPGEGLDRIVAVEAPMGSLVLWHGNTWHGAYRRQAKGLRMAIAFLYARRFLLTREPYREDVTKEQLDRNPPRFATLMGQEILAGWRAEGPDYSRLDTTSRADRVHLGRQIHGHRRQSSAPSPKTSSRGRPTTRDSSAASAASAGVVTFPRSSGCPRCGAPNPAAAELSPRGTLWTFTTQEFEVKEPYIGTGPNGAFEPVRPRVRRAGGERQGRDAPHRERPREAANRHGDGARRRARLHGP